MMKFETAKKAAMETENIIPDIPSGSFGQWSADNVATIQGHLMEKPPFMAEEL